MLWINFSFWIFLFDGLLTQTIILLFRVAVKEFDRIHQTRHIIALRRVLSIDVLSLLTIVSIHDRVKQRLCMILSLFRYLIINFSANCLEFLLKIKFINHVWEIFDIVLIVHLCKFFKNDKLINGRVNEIAASLLKLFKFLLRSIYLGYESFNGFICFRYAIFVLNSLEISIPNIFKHCSVHRSPFM